MAEKRDWYKPRHSISVLLTCGHTVQVQMQPWRNGSTFSCENNSGCGYTLGWIRWDDSKSGKSGINPKYAK